ncbi:unnamed protein product [Rotaria sordida]|uniref:Reverse transcriptase domain-containing protein n=1 Tax=Rotaria sordida TaxID=392033 RepID=A0A815VER6_9BILA|nr:unnamed protein product [Rotaria sordida]CAF1531445.1 unnamed protein product [Rotaria sordida]
MGIEILQECCWIWSFQALSQFRQQQYCQPKIPSSSLSILHYNIRYFYSNQADLIDMVNVFSPTIISLNELGTMVPAKTIKQLLFPYNVYLKEGTNSHGGVFLAVDKRLRCHLIEINEPNIIEVQMIVGDQQFVVASIYSPLTDRLPLATMTTLLNHSKNIIIAGDLNAKHPDWDCPQVNTKGRDLSNWLMAHNLNVLNADAKTSLRSNTTIGLIISSEFPEISESQTLAYAGNDHLPTFTKFLCLNVSMDKHLVPRTFWKLYSSILTVIHDQLQADQEISINDSNITYKWFIMFEQFLAALKLRVTEWKEVKRKRPSISPSLRILLRHKHYLQNRYRHTKHEEDRLRLRSWNILVKQEFRAYKQRNWEQFISNVASPNPSTFWNTVKMLNKKESIDFSALTDGNTVHRSPEDIVKCLSHHFTERHSPPSMNMVNVHDREADELWKLYSLADKDDIKLISSQSDLQFDEQDITNTIRSLKNKNSFGFDQVSNKMVKLLPTHHHLLLAHAYNDLFRAAHWGKEWKTARTICLNKSDHPAPTANQLRPISLFPTFTFDKLWQQGLLLKLNRFNCPSAYLAWIASYFSDRTLKINYGGVEPVLVNVERGAPQGSCLGPVLYVISHYDLTQYFENPGYVHAYVDDIAIAYVPSIHLKSKFQVVEIEERDNLAKYHRRYVPTIYSNLTCSLCDTTSGIAPPSTRYGMSRTRT